MPIASGTRIGAYEVVGPIGAGGMGEVYRARDHRLQRDVALKVLSDAWAANPDRLARFRREARTLATLNHPNIAIIHDIADEADGSPALVMELVEGPTLSDRIARGPLPLAEVITIALQIAEALEAAHEHGVLHRDLKPANVKVRADGTVKLLDFGLAKTILDTDAGADGDTTASPAMRSAMTGIGVIVGTAAYMSPEQARGQSVDKRADIWAFGCVLYEMVTSRRAFAGETATDTLAAVVGREPDWSALPANLPSSLVALLRRCLEKNPRDRLRDIGDARIELRSISHGRDQSAGSLTNAAQTRWRPRAAAFFGAGAAAAALITYFAMTPSPRVSSPLTPVRLVVTLPPGVTLALGRGSSVVLSPDGSRLIYAGRSSDESVRLYSRPLDRYEAEAIPGTDAAANPFFSPDGRWLGFVADRHLKKVALDGGAPVALNEVRALRGQAWTADGILLTPANNSGLVRLAETGGTMEPFTSLGPGEMSHRWPHVLADGSVLFTVWNDTGWDPSRIVARRSGSSAHEVVVERGGGHARYVRDASTGRGYLVFARSEGLLAAPFDTSTLRLTAPAVPVVDGVVTNLSGGAHFDLSPDGTLAYVPGTSTEAERDLVWVSLDGSASPARRLTMGRFFSLSPDGTRVMRINTVGQRDLWIEDLVRGTSTRLTDTADNFTGIWSPDGAWTVFSKGAPAADLYRRRTDRGGTNERLTTSGRNPSATSFSPDGAWVAYQEIDPVTGVDIWILAVPGGSSASGTASAEARVRPFLTTRFNESGAMFSPDGRWIAYQSNESGRFEVYIRSFPDAARVVQVSTDGGIAPAWSPRGQEILYRGTNGMMMAVPVRLGPEVHVGTPRTLFDARRYESEFEVAPDGRRLLMMRTVDNEAAGTVIHVVLNFLAELRQRAW